MTHRNLVGHTLWTTLAAGALSLLAMIPTHSAEAVDGQPDPLFGSGGFVVDPIDAGGNLTDLVTAVVVQPDHRVLVGGYATTGSGTWRGYVARFLNNGLLDTTFGGSGEVSAFPIAFGNHQLRALLLQPDGRIVTVGTVDEGPSGQDFIISRLLADGSFDPSFATLTIDFAHGPDSIDDAQAAVLERDGQIVVVGGAHGGDGKHDFAACRVNANGTLDFGFGTAGKVLVPFDFDGSVHDIAHAVAVQADGKLVLAGRTTYSLIGTVTSINVAVARLLSNGSLDVPFGFGGITAFAFDLGGSKADPARAVAIQDDGRILLAGEAGNGDRNSWLALRLTRNGNLDPTFDGDGWRVGTFRCGSVTCDLVRARAYSIAVQGDGKILLAGEDVGYHGPLGDDNQDFGVARLLANGSFDSTFLEGGFAAYDFDRGIGSHDDSGHALALAPDGRLVIAGSVEFNGFDSDWGVLRLENSYVFADGFERGSTSDWSASAGLS